MTEGTPKDPLTPAQIEELRKLREKFEAERSIADTSSIISNDEISRHLQRTKNSRPSDEAEDMTADAKIRSLTIHLSTKIMTDPNRIEREMQTDPVEYFLTERSVRLDEKTVVSFARSVLMGTEQVDVIAYHWPEGQKISHAEEKARYSISENGLFNARYMPYSQEPDRHMTSLSHATGGEFTKEAQTAFDSLTALTTPYLELT